MGNRQTYMDTPNIYEGLMHPTAPHQTMLNLYRTLSEHVRDWG